MSFRRMNRRFSMTSLGTAIALGITILASACSKDDKPGAPPMTNPGGGSGGNLAHLGGASGGGAAGASSDPIDEVPVVDGVCLGVQCGENEGCFVEGDFAVCQCLSGFSGPDCQDINECADVERCGAGGVCENFPGSFSCSCSAGYATTDAGCQDVDDCAKGTDVCDDHATCDDQEGTHICTCDPGRFGDGTFCKTSDACAGDPCGEGTCKNTPSGFSCLCPLGTSGPTCEQACPVDEPLTFASALLQAAVQASTGITGDITPAKLAGFTALYAPPPDKSLGTDDEIRSLDGLECWPTLETLDLRGHGISDLSALGSLGALKEAHLACSEAEDLSPLSHLSQLRSLDLSKGALCSDTERSPRSLEFLSDLTSLRTLDLSAFGYVEDLEHLNALRRLETLNVRGLEVEDITAVADLTQLRELVLTQNPITDLEALEGLPYLSKFHLSTGSLTSLAFLEDLESLVEVDVSHNQLTSLGPFANLTHLKFANASGNDISDLEPLGELKHLIEVDLSQNSISDLGPLAQNLSFSGGQLWISENPLSCSEASNDLWTLSSRGVALFDDCD